MRTGKTLAAIILEVEEDGGEFRHVSEIHIPGGLRQNVLAELAVSIANGLEVPYQHWMLEAITEMTNGEVTTPQFGSDRPQLSVVPSAPPDEHGANEMFESVFGDD